MNDTMQLITIFVGVIGGFKALEWVIEKITKTHDKAQKIDKNAENYEELKKKTDELLKDMQKQLDDGHRYSTVAMEELKKELTDILEAHRTEYLEGINDVRHSITEMSSIYQQTVAIIELKIDNLEKKQDKHNSVIERTYKLEKDVAVLQNKERVSQHRLDDLEKANK